MMEWPVEDGWRHSGSVTQKSLRTPQALVYSRASAASKDVVDDFFAKLGALYGRLNLISKPMQVYNVDETCITVVHKPGKVFSAVGRKHVYSLTSGKTYSCGVCLCKWACNPSLHDISEEKGCS